MFHYSTRCVFLALICILSARQTNCDEVSEEIQERRPTPSFSRFHVKKPYPSKVDQREIEELKRLNELRFASEAKRALDAKILEDHRKMKELVRTENFVKEENINRVVEANRRAEEVRRKNFERKNTEIIRRN